VCNPQHSIHTIPELLDYCEKEYAACDAFLWRKGEEIHSVTYARFAKQVRGLAACFAAQTEESAHIAILGANSYHWLLGWFAVVCAGRVAVPLDPQLTCKSHLELLEQSDAQLLLYDKDFGDVAAMFGNGMRLDELPVGKDTAGWPCDTKPGDMAAILFTSGTTGKPKGVMLSQNHFTCNALSSARRLKFLEGNKILVVLPLYHSASLVSVFVHLYGGSPQILSGIMYLSRDFGIFKPKFCMVVPLMVAKMYEQIWIVARKQKKDKLLRALLACSDGLLKLGIDLRCKFFRPVLSAFGELEWMLCGGAALSDELMRGFLRFGMEISPAYGATECTTVVAIGRRGDYRAHSVGKALDCNEVKIDEQGEILVKGDNVFMGYYKDEEATREAFTADGWYKTGDLGRLDEDGYLYITGRLKNLIILSNGKNVSPEALEQKLTDIPYIKEALVFESENEIAAELFLDEEVPNAAKQLEADLSELNRQLPVYQQITKTSLRSTEFPKTTTKKIIRKRAAQ